MAFTFDLLQEPTVDADAPPGGGYFTDRAWSGETPEDAAPRRAGWEYPTPREPASGAADEESAPAPLVRRIKGKDFFGQAAVIPTAETTGTSQPAADQFDVRQGDGIGDGRSEMGDRRSEGSVGGGGQGAADFYPPNQAPPQAPSPSVARPAASGVPEGAPATSPFYDKARRALNEAVDAVDPLGNAVSLVAPEVGARVKNYQRQGYGAMAEGAGRALTGAAQWARQTLARPLDYVVPGLTHALGLQPLPTPGVVEGALQPIETAGQALRAVPEMITDPAMKDNWEARLGRVGGGIAALVAQGYVAPATLVPTLFAQGYAGQYEAAQEHAAQTGQPLDEETAHRAGVIGGGINAVLGVPLGSYGKVVSEVFGQASTNAVRAALDRAYVAGGAKAVGAVLTRLRSALLASRGEAGDALFKGAALEGMKNVIRELMTTSGQRVGRVATRMATDAAIGAGAQVAQNLNARQYDPEKPLLEGVGQQAGTFAVLGGLFGTMAQRVAAVKAAQARSDIAENLARAREVSPERAGSAPGGAPALGRVGGLGAPPALPFPAPRTSPSGVPQLPRPASLAALDNAGTPSVKEAGTAGLASSAPSQPTAPAKGSASPEVETQLATLRQRVQRQPASQMDAALLAAEHRRIAELEATSPAKTDRSTPAVSGQKSANMPLAGGGLTSALRPLTAPPDQLRATTVENPPAKPLPSVIPGLDELSPPKPFAGTPPEPIAPPSPTSAALAPRPVASTHEAPPAASPAPLSRDWGVGPDDLGQEVETRNGRRGIIVQVSKGAVKIRKADGRSFAETRANTRLRGHLDRNLTQRYDQRYEPVASATPENSEERSGFQSWNADSAGHAGARHAGSGGGDRAGAPRRPSDGSRAVSQRFVGSKHLIREQFARLGARIVKKGFDEVGGGMSTRKNGEIWINVRRLGQTAARVVADLVPEFYRAAFVEELAHHAHNLVFPDNDVQSAAFWARLSPDLRSLVQNAYRATDPSTHGAEALRMFVQVRHGFPLTESFYTDTAGLEAALREPQSPRVEDAITRVGEMLLHGKPTEGRGAPPGGPETRGLGEARAKDPGAPGEMKKGARGETTGSPVTFNSGAPATSLAPLPTPARDWADVHPSDVGAVIQTKTGDRGVVTSVGKVVVRYRAGDGTVKGANRAHARVVTQVDRASSSTRPPVMEGPAVPRLVETSRNTERMPPVKAPTPGRGIFEEPRKATKEEAQIINRPVELATIYGPDGAVRGRKQGDANQIEFTSAEVEDFKDTTFSHNHPDGNSFSDADLAFAASADLAEIRIISGAHGGGARLYRLRRPQGGWRIASYTLLRMYAVAADVVRARQTEQIKAGEMSRRQARREFVHEIMKELQEQAPQQILYERIDL